MATLKEYLLIIAAALSLILMPAAANAQYVQLSCNGTGGISQGTFYDQSTTTGVCQYSGIQHVFSQIVCNFVIILNLVMDTVYCGIQYNLTPLLAIVLTLYLILFGAQILMGTAQLNGKEMFVRLMKISCVWVLATNSTWGINFMFNFFIGAATEGAKWVVNSISSVDNSIDGLTNVMPVSLGPPNNIDNLMAMYAYIDQLMYSAITAPFSQTSQPLIGFFIVLLFFFPTLFALVSNWLLNTIMMLIDAMVDFLLDLSAIAFLLALSFIFLSFLLFQATHHLFEDWLKYIISYTLRVIIIFAIIALWIVVMNIFSGFFAEISNMVVSKRDTVVDIAFNVNDTFGICEYEGIGMMWSPPNNPGGACVPSLPCMPAMVCDGSDTVLSPSDLETRPDFIYFLTYNLTVLSIISYAFRTLMKQAPQIAKALSGPASVPPWGGGFGMKAFGQVAKQGGGEGKMKPPAGSGEAVNSFIENLKKTLGMR